MRKLGECKQIKKKIKKLTGYQTLLMKQVANLESIEIDSNMMDVFKDSNKVLEEAQQQQDEVLDTLEDAQDVNQEIEDTNAEIDDLLNQ